MKKARRGLLKFGHCVDAIAKRRFCPAWIELMRARCRIVYRGLCADYRLWAHNRVSAPKIAVSVGQESPGLLFALLALH
jgi:hypothetical protein